MAQQTDRGEFYGIEEAIVRGELRMEWGSQNSAERIPLTREVLLSFINVLREQAGMKPYYPNAPALGGKPQDNSPSLGTNKGRGQTETPDQ